MQNDLGHQVNAVLGSLTVTIGLWLLIGALPVSIGVAMGIALAILLAWKCPSKGYICTESLEKKSAALSYFLLYIFY